MSIDTPADRLGMERAGKVVAQALKAMRAAVQPGVTTAELDGIAATVFAEHGARSAPQLVYHFPGVTCISVNDEAVHGIPSHRRLEAGDLVKLDVTAELDGYIADAAATVALAPTTGRQKRVMRCAEAAFWKALPAAQPGNRVSEIGRAVEREVTRLGCSVLRPLKGHGVGRTIHEKPDVPNYFDPHDETLLVEGMVLTIEPIISAGSTRIYRARDGWTIKTWDGSPTAHYEQTLAITAGGPLLLTAS